MGEASPGNRIGNSRSSPVCIGYFPCALYSNSQQACPGPNGSKGPGPPDNLLKGKHGNTTEDGNWHGGQVYPSAGLGVPPEKDSAGQHEDEYDET